MKKLKGVFIGQGMRGRSLYATVVLPRDDVEITAICDISQAHCDMAVERVVKAGKKAPKTYLDYKQCIDENKPDFVIVSTSWVAHLEVSMYAMERGIPVGCEVGGGYTLESLWELVHCYERTRTPIMLLENCCYGRIELLTLNMKRLGLLGEIVHCEVAYRHDLRGEITNVFSG